MTTRKEKIIKTFSIFLVFYLFFTITWSFVIKTCVDCVTNYLNVISYSGAPVLVGKCQQIFTIAKPRKIHNNLQINDYEYLGKRIYSNYDFYSELASNLNSESVSVTLSDECGEYYTFSDTATLKKDENSNYVILRNPKLATTYYTEPYFTIKYDTFLLRDLKEIEDFMFYYLNYDVNYRPIIFFRYAFPIELNSFFINKNMNNADPTTKINSLQVLNVKQPYIPIFEGADMRFSDVTIIANLVGYLDDDNLETNLSNIIAGSNLEAFNLIKEYSSSSIKAYLLPVMLPYSFEYEYNGTQYKLDDDVQAYFVSLPRGLLLSFIKEPSCWGVAINRSLVNELHNNPKFGQGASAVYNSFINSIISADISKIFGINTQGAIVSIGEVYNNILNNLDNYKNNVEGCVYYYKEKVLGQLNGKDIILYTGKIIPNNVYFVATDDYYFWDGGVLKKFNKNEVYLCKNNEWIDLDNDESECINFMNKFYDQYNKINPIYLNNECLINEIDEHKVWYREYKEGKVIEDLNKAIKNKKAMGFADCVDENGNLLNNFEIDSNNRLCSFGILTPVFDDINKFYIEDFPQNVTFSFNLSNFASEPIELVDYELEGLPKTWSYKIHINNTLIPAKSDFNVELTLFNFEEDGSQKNLTLKLLFQLKDGRNQIMIPVEIPFRVQFTKEFLTKVEISDDIIFDEDKGKTNNIVLSVEYNFYGKLKDIRWCDYSEVVNRLSNDLCKFVFVNFTLPKDCTPVSVSSLPQTSNSKASIEFYCNKAIDENDKVVVCSKTFLLNKSGLIDITNTPSLVLNNKAHCTEISLKSTSYIKDFLLTTSQKKDEDGNYYLFVNIENIGNTNLKGVNITITDKTGNCGLKCLSSNSVCSVRGNVLHYSNPNENIPVGDTLTKTFMIVPTGICELNINVIIDDPIEKNTTVVINPYLEEGYSKTIVKGNPSLYGYFVLALALIFFLIGVYKIREEFN